MTSSRAKWARLICARRYRNTPYACLFPAGHKGFHRNAFGTLWTDDQCPHFHPHRRRTPCTLTIGHKGMHDNGNGVRWSNV